MKKLSQYLLACCLLAISAFSAKSQVACYADFMWGTNPNGVFTFYDSSYAVNGYNLIQWSWDFGDGTFSNQQNPTHNYSAPGTYNVCLITKAQLQNTTDYCYDTTCRSVVFTCPTYIQGSFTATTTNQSVVFNSTYSSNNPPHTYLWNFGDGATSTDEDISHTYTTAGTYTVCLTVTNALGCSRTDCKVVTVGNPNPCVLNAYYSSSLSATSLLLDAHDSLYNATGTVLNKWYINGNLIADCNGLNCSTTANVSQYVGTGIQTVCLVARVDGTNCTDTFCKAINFGTNNTCNLQANFSYNQPTQNTFVVTAASTGGNPTANLHKWYLAGVQLGQSTGNSTSFTFTVPNTIPDGTHQLCAIVEVPNVSPACKDTICKNVYVCKANAEFAYQILTNDTVKFQPSPSSLNYLHKWIVNGAVVSTNNDPKIKFNVPINGLEVCHVVYTTGSNCTDTFCTTLSTACNLDANFQWIDSGSFVMFFPSNSNTSNISHLWTFGDGTSSSSVSPDHAYNQIGTFNVCHILKSNSNSACNDTVCKAITVGNCTFTGVVLQPTQLPNGQVKVMAIPTGGTAPYTYSWGSDTTIVTPDPVNPLIVFITVTDANGCTATSGTAIGPIPAPTNSKLCGTVFEDSNGNGVKDSTESGLSAYIVVSGNGLQATLFSDSISGEWFKNVPAGTYNVCVYIGNTVGSGWTSTVPINSNTTPNQGNCYSVTVADSQVLCGLNFGFKSNNTKVCGFIYVDVNSNGTKDAGEPGIAGQPVNVGSATVYTNNDGYYAINLPAGTYTLTYTPAAPYTGYTSSPATHSVAATTPGQVYCGNNFGVVVPPSQCDVAVSITPLSTVTPGFTALYSIKVYNLNGVTTGGLLTFNFEPGLLFKSASPTQASFSNSSAFVTWNVTNLTPGTYKSFTARLDVPVNTQLGTQVFSFAEFTTNGSCTEANLVNNIDTTHQTVVGSYDPNDKHVSPEGSIADVAQELVYTIRFQNTGTAPAVNVVIADTLHANLNYSTFEFKDASHPVTIQQEGKYLNFIFSNIMLPDSFSNEPESHGFVSYKVKAMSNLGNGAQITNTAAIYFDFNEPVITNTTLNTIDIALSVEDINNSVNIVLAPNPMRDYTNISISGAADAPVQLEIRDMAGRLIQQQITEGNVLRVNRNGFSSGLYIYQLKQNNKIIGTGKLIAE